MNPYDASDAVVTAAELMRNALVRGSFEDVTKHGHELINFLGDVMTGITTGATSFEVDIMDHTGVVWFPGVISIVDKIAGGAESKLVTFRNGKTLLLRPESYGEEKQLALMHIMYDRFKKGLKGGE